MQHPEPKLTTPLKMCLRRIIKVCQNLANYMARSTRLGHFSASTQEKSGSASAQLFCGWLLRLRLRLTGLMSVRDRIYLY